MPLSNIQSRNWKRLVMAYAVTQGLIGFTIMNVPLFLILVDMNDRSALSIITGFSSIALGGAITIASANIYEVHQSNNPDPEGDGIEMQVFNPA